MSSINDDPAIVIDTGSAFCKSGFGGDHFPRSVIPSVVGRFKRGKVIDGFPDIYCGKEAIKYRGLSSLTWPVAGGLIQNWDEIEKLWHYVFYKELYAAPEEYKVMHAIHPLMSSKDRETLAELMFETFNVKGIFMMNSPSLILHSTGRTSGLVWESGYSCAHAVPIFEGFPLSHAIMQSKLCGETMSNTLQKMLAAIGYNFTTPAERDIIDDIKAKLCYVAKYYNEEIENSDIINKPHRYELPDGQHILVGKKRFMCPEVLFEPSLAELKCPNLVDLVCASIDRCDIDYRSMFYENIVLAGGSTLFPGLEQRLQRELSEKFAIVPDVNINVEAPESRQFSTWEGGSIISSLSSLKNAWVTSEQYEDVGSEIVHHNFF